MILKIILVIVTLTYPFIVYFGLTHFDPTIIMCFIITLLIVRALTEKQHNTRKVMFVMAIGVLVVAYFWGNQQGLKLYPVIVNTAMLMLFTSSLCTKQSIIERMARIKEPNLPESGVRYTKKVTIIWCVFFTLNGLIALFTALWASNEVWLFYNGFLAYVLIGVLVVTEWIVRYKFKQKA